jgi:outer membrane protein OmpA-like peptidoglycan-associated protein
MGDVVAPQDSMDDYKLTTGNIYTEALAYAGADGLELNLKNNPSAQAVETDYTVDRVYAEELKLGDDVMVDDTITKFINNQTSLQNPDEVKKYLNSFVSKYKMSGNKTLLVTGYMDHCLPNKKDLSLGRAETIKSILVEMGIPAENIKTTGEIGPPPTNFDELYKCVDDTNMPDEEQRTVRIAVVG